MIINKGNEENRWNEKCKENNDLERILNREVSLKTDVMEFLLIAGWDYYRAKTYKKADNDLRERLKGYVENRKKLLTKSERNMEGRFSMSILDSYWSGEIKTLQDLHTLTRNKGLIKGIYYKTLGYFNNTLEKYGINSLEVSGRGVSEEYLKRYGLKRH